MVLTQTTAMPDAPAPSLSAWFDHVHKQIENTYTGPSEIPDSIKLSAKKREQMINLFKNKLRK